MKRILVTILLGLVLSGCGLTKEKAKTVDQGLTLSPKIYEPVVVDMIQMEKSGVQGIATIKQEGKMTRVIINLSAPKGASEPAHVHFGVCPKPGAIKYVLHDVVNGDSETLLEVPIEELVASGSMAINVHKSNADYATYVSCGDIAP